MELYSILDFIDLLPTASKIKLERCVTEVSYPKGHLLMHAGKIEPYIYFVKKGILRVFTHSIENEITLLFCKEGDAIVSMRSYVSNQKGYEDVELLEDTVLYKMETKTLRELYANDLHIANWGRKFAEQELIKTEERFISRQFRTATERYMEILEKNPELIQRVQLGHIASYLGITQVSLSRIRAEIK